MNIKDRLREKREWQNYRRRIKALPKDYQMVFYEMEKYLFKVHMKEEMTEDNLSLAGVLELFEEGAALHKQVIEITGTDIAAFCDEL